jgi:hypothetical protein
MYDLLVPSSQPWPAGAEANRRLTRTVLITQVTTGILGVLVIFYLLGISGHDVALAGVVSGAYAVFAGGSAWLLYHFRKAGAIKRAAELGTVEDSQPIN